MRNIFSTTAVLISALMFSPLSLAAQSADEILKECQARAEGAADQNAAVSTCINEKLQYDTSSSD